MQWSWGAADSSVEPKTKSDQEEMGVALGNH